MNRLTLAIGLALSAGSLRAAETPATPVAAVAPAAAPDAAAPAPSIYTYDPLKVIGQRLFPYQEGMSLDRRYIDEQIRGNGDIGTLLRINPSVQFDDTAATSRNMGEIRPADISINGGLYYQNAFVLDGASFNNDTAPGGSTLAASIIDVPSHSQGIALDASQIGTLTVYDSNVPASYGGFSGGVVEAESRRARDAFSGSVVARMQRSVWNETHIVAPAVQNFEQSSTESLQPRYDKYQLRATLEGRTRNGLGLSGTVSRLRSVIPLRGYTAGRNSPTDENEKEQVRENTSASLRADWSDGDGLEISASVNYAPTDERYFIVNAKNGYYDLKQGGPVASARVNYQRGDWTWRNTLSYSDLDSSRRSQTDYWKSWARSSEMDWGVTTLSAEGSWGNIDQRNRNLGYKLVLEREPLRLGRGEHRLQFGLEYRDRNAEYHRLNDHYSYLTPAATLTCTAANGGVDRDGCSLAPVDATGSGVIKGRGQYFTRRNLYREGAFSVDNREWAVFAQDDLRLGRWSLRPGVRVDGDSLMGRTTVAPRLAASWDVFGDRDTLLTAGVNRYYGRNIFAYKLREGRERLQLEQRRGADLIWRDVRVSPADYRFDRLRVPYGDELALGWNQRWAGLDLSLKYVRRDNRDEVLRQTIVNTDDSGFYDTRVNRYDNRGRSRSQTYTASLAPAQPLRWGPAVTTAEAAFDYTDVRRNYTDYETVYSETFETWVRYQGKLMRTWELPATSFNRPWTARLATQTRWEAAGLLWSNFLRYRSGYRGKRTVGNESYQGEAIAVIEEVAYPATWTWDSAVEWTLRLPRDQQAYARVEAQNLTNRANLISSATTATTVYEPGRSYWLELGYRF
uniref:TonB-dependent outer membrane receptor n=1 Tax=Lysobacter sp. ATCC 53042 TaxID=324869 RepID=F8TUF2_9GAMM|nr:TonB-dependent outer membrane receptor [Lysobacter sp. ATCC 53042]